MLRLLMAFGLVNLAAGTAHAEVVEGMLPNGAVLSWPRLKIAPNFDPSEDIEEPADSEQFRQHLNLAACTCSRDNPDVDTSLYFELGLTGLTGNLPAEVVVGSECANDDLFQTNCRVISAAAIADLDAISMRETFVEVSLFDLINAAPPADPNVPEACRQTNGGTALVWVVADADRNGDRDYYDSQEITGVSNFADAKGFDTQPPPLPDNIRATGGEGAIELQWETPDSLATDLYAFQAFCMNEDGTAVGGGGTPLYSTTETICGIPTNLALTAVSNTGDGPESTAPLPFTSLDKNFICGTQESGTATSITIKDLENGKPYFVALVAVDFYGNPTGAFLTRSVTPQPVTDFWEDIHDRGGKVEGGLCSTSGTDALPGLLLPFGLVWLLRRKKKLAPLALLGGLFAMPSLARADDFTPYWEDPKNTTESGAEIYEDHIKWHVGIKLGPYTPAIDDQFKDLKDPATGMAFPAGPYAAMFGNYYVDDDGDGVLDAHDKHVYQFLPMLDVERVVWSGSGQIALGGTLGYMQKKAFAFEDNSSPLDPLRPRSKASSNTFRLIPFALTASYRVTQLDDLWGIPVVPYLRGGLAYYVWWMKGPSGSLSKVCSDGSMDSGCKSNKAYGGSLGLQGTLGLSIRAERIDRDAARAMKQSGIYHAGFYIEGTSAVVNGFGSDTKLSVGDTTWFGGFDFEF